MIKLPDDYMDSVRVLSSLDPLSAATVVVLFYKNRSNQYFSRYEHFSGKRDLPRALAILRTLDLSKEEPYMGGTTERGRALDQKWRPAPEMIPKAIPLGQYDARYA